MVSAYPCGNRITKTRTHVLNTCYYTSEANDRVREDETTLECVFEWAIEENPPSDEAEDSNRL